MNIELPPQRMVKRAREPRIMEPKNAEERKEQDQKQAEAAEVTKNDQRRQWEEDRAKLLHADAARARSEALGGDIVSETEASLPARMDEAPVRSESGRKRKFAADMADRQGAKRKGQSRAAMARGRG